MPFIGLGLHVLIALFFAVHAMRHGKQMYWLLILFSFPLLGSIVYFVVEYLPASRMQRTAGKVANAAIGFIDPEREYRAAAEAYDLAPTAQNKLRIAKAALDRGQVVDAVGHYRDALKGPLASDPELQFGLASALLAAGGATAGREALQALQTLRSTRDDYRKDEVAVLIARALAADGQQAEARQAFEEALSRYNTVEARARSSHGSPSRRRRRRATPVGRAPAGRAPLELARTFGQSRMDAVGRRRRPGLSVLCPRA